MLKKLVINNLHYIAYTIVSINVAYVLIPL